MPKTKFLYSILFVLSAACLAGQPQARIAAAEAKLKAGPPSSSLYIDLAAALCREGRDTEDQTIYKRAEDALNHSLQLSPGNYEARKLQVSVLLGQHDFAAALKLASELNHKVPDDLTVWALLVDANIALGNYSEAERQAQWVLDLRPGNTLGFEKAAELRVLFGDVPGAIQFLDEANRRTSAEDSDQHAWLLTQKADLQLASGYANEAEALLQQAFQIFPDSLFATEVLAKVRMAQGKFGEAATLDEKRCRRVKNARNLYDWAEALEESGEKEQAAAAFKRFEQQAQAESSKPFNANLQLTFFDLNEKHDPAAALTLATAMSAGRHDCATLDAYAWALYANGKFSEAKTQMDRALAVGVRDPVYLCHASQIAAGAGDFKYGSCQSEKAQMVSTAPATDGVSR